MKKILEHLVYSNVFIALCAAALVLANQLCMGKEAHIDANVLFVFCGTLFTYSLLKYRSTDASGISSTEHREWAAMHQQLSRNIQVIALVCAVVFFFRLHSYAMFTVLALGVFIALYALVDIPITSKLNCLRDFALAKPFFVGFAWAMLTVLLPSFETEIDSTSLGILLARRFLFVSALTLVFEIKDMHADEIHGLRTWPLRFGVPNTKLLAQALLLALICMLLLQYFAFNEGFAQWQLIALLVSICATSISIWQTEENNSSLYYYSVLDGMMLLQFFLLFAMSFAETTTV